MTDTDNPFGTFAPQPAPMFEGTVTPAAQAAEPSPQRKSRRSKRTAAAPGPTSSAEKPKRKYTRRKPTVREALTESHAALQGQPKPGKIDLTALAGLTEAEIGIIARLLEMPGIELVKIGKALQKLGAA